MKVILSFGGNKEGTKESFEKAIVLIEKNIGEITLKSSVLETKPWGFKVKTSDFLNQIIELKTMLSPKELLQKTQEIEIKLGRKSKSIGEIYQDRILDIDILFYEDLILKSPQLTIPHVFIQDRSFILEPMQEILPNFVHPIFNKSIKELLLLLHFKKTPFTNK